MMCTYFTSCILSNFIAYSHHNIHSCIHYTVYFINLIIIIICVHRIQNITILPSHHRHIVVWHAIMFSLSEQETDSAASSLLVGTGHRYIGVYYNYISYIYDKKIYLSFHLNLKYEKCFFSCQHTIIFINVHAYL